MKACVKPSYCDAILVRVGFDNFDISRTKLFFECADSLSRRASRMRELLINDEDTARDGPSRSLHHCLSSRSDTPVPSDEIIAVSVILDVLQKHAFQRKAQCRVLLE
jgi:hypothetical protein